MTAPEYIQLKAYARQDGFFLALLWITSFIFYIIGLSNSLLAMASLIMAIVSPFFVASRLRNFRDVGREGFISFGRSYAYTIFVFFYGAVLLAVVQYLYFAYFDCGRSVGLFLYTTLFEPRRCACNGGNTARFITAKNSRDIKIKRCY